MNPVKNSTPPQPLNVHTRLDVYYRLGRKKTAVQLFIMVGSELYGPYKTSIQTSETTWSLHRTPNQTPAVNNLRRQLLALRRNLVEAWSALLFTEHKENVVLTGNMVLVRAGLQKLIGTEDQTHAN